MEARRGEKPGVDGAASASGGRRTGGREVAERMRLEEVLERLVDEVEHPQARNRQARKSHEKRTRRLLRERGIRLTKMARCRRLS